MLVGHAARGAAFGWSRQCCSEGAVAREAGGGGPVSALAAACLPVPGRFSCCRRGAARARRTDAAPAAWAQQVLFAVLAAGCFSDPPHPYPPSAAAQGCEPGAAWLHCHPGKGGRRPGRRAHRRGVAGAVLCTVASAVQEPEARARPALLRLPPRRRAARPPRPGAADPLARWAPPLPFFPLLQPCSRPLLVRAGSAMTCRPRSCTRMGLCQDEVAGINMDSRR